MNADWKVEKAQYAEFNVPTCGKIASWQLCRETQPVWNSHDGLNLTCLDQWIQELTSLFSLRWLFQVCLGKPSHGSMPLWTSVFFCAAQATPKIRPRPAQRLFSNTSVWTTAKSIFPMKERWGRLRMLRYDEFNVPTCANFAVCQLRRETQPVWHSHDGLNLTCLDQCHGVRSHGTSSSKCWRKRFVTQSTVWIWSMSLHPCFRRRWLLQVRLGKLSHRSMPLWTSVFSVVAQATQDSPKASPRKNFIEQLKLLLKNECWLKGGEGPVCWVQCANMWQDCKLTAVQRNTACVEQSWWPEFDMFGSMPWCWFPWHKLLPRLSKRIVIQQSEFDPRAHILVFAGGDCCRFAWESLATEIGKSRHWTSVFLCVAQTTPKIRPRPAQRLFSNTSVWTTAKSIFPMKERWGRLRMLRYGWWKKSCTTKRTWSLDPRAPHLTLVGKNVPKAKKLNDWNPAPAQKAWEHNIEQGVRG